MVDVSTLTYTDGVTNWLTAEEQAAWRAYVTMSGKLTARLGRRLVADSALSMADFEVLVHLSEHPDGRMRAFELARALEWEKSRLSHHLSRMSGRGLINRRDCPSDARGSIIELTEQGRRAIERAAPGHVEAVRELFLDQLSAEQITALRALSTKVLARLEADSADECVR